MATKVKSTEFKAGDEVTYRGSTCQVTRVKPNGKLVLMVMANGWSQIPGDVDPANVKRGRV